MQVDTIFLLDLVGHFFMGYFDDGDAVVSLEQLIPRYLKSYFLLDAAAAVPLWPGVWGATSIVQFLRLLRWLRWFRLKHVSEVQEGAMLAAVHGASMHMCQSLTSRCNHAL